MPTRRSLHATRPSASMSLLRPGHAEAHLDLRAAVERAGRADGDAAAAEVERQRRGDRVAEAVLDRDAEHDARAAAAVEVVGEQVRRERRQDVLHRAVLVDVAGDAERRQLAHFVGARDRAAEDQHRQPCRRRACGSTAPDPRPARAAAAGRATIRSIVVEIGADARQQLGRALDRDRFVPGVLERRAEAVAHERGVVGDDDGLGRDRGAGHLVAIGTRLRALARVADCARYRYNSTDRIAAAGGILARHDQCQVDATPTRGDMATCPECDAEIEVDEFDVDKGDQLSCPECGSNLEVTGLSPLELDIAPDDRRRRRRR